MAKPTQQQIYARRRLLALIAVTVVSALIWLGTAGIPALLRGDGGVETPDPGLTEGTEVQPTNGETEPIACPPGSVLAEAFVGNEDGVKQSFSSGETPLIWYSLTNLGPVPCVFNAGARVTFFTISSGEETIWSSRDCDRTGDSDLSVLLQPNLPFLAEKAPWMKVRSSDTGCGETQRRAVAGGASYHLKVEVNGEISTNRQQFLLN
jgi:hypothetical protein